MFTVRRKLNIYIKCRWISVFRVLGNFNLLCRVIRWSEFLTCCEMAIALRAASVLKGQTPLMYVLKKLLQISTYFWTIRWCCNNCVHLIFPQRQWVSYEDSRHACWVCFYVRLLYRQINQLYLIYPHSVRDSYVSDPVCCQMFLMPM